MCHLRRSSGAGHSAFCVAAIAGSGDSAHKGYPALAKDWRSWAWVPTNSARARATPSELKIAHMVELGGTVIDTAPAYGDSETIIGDVLAALGIRDRISLATKLTPGAGRNGAGGQAGFERSLKRLRTPRIDFLQVPNLDGVDEFMPTLLKWKQAGRIHYLGITTSRIQQHGQMVKVMHRYPLDFYSGRLFARLPDEAMRRRMEEFWDSG